MICSTFLNIDATISFKTVKDFFLATSPSGKCETINTDSEFHYKYSGDALVLNYMWVKLLNIGMSSHVVTHSSPKNQNEELKNVLYSTVVGSGNGSNMKSNIPRLEVRGISQGNALGLATRSVSHMK